MVTRIMMLIAIAKYFKGIGALLGTIDALRVQGPKYVGRGVILSGSPSPLYMVVLHGTSKELGKGARTPDIL